MKISEVIDPHSSKEEAWDRLIGHDQSEISELYYDVMVASDGFRVRCFDAYSPEVVDEILEVLHLLDHSEAKVTTESKCAAMLEELKRYFAEIG